MGWRQAQGWTLAPQLGPEATAISQGASAASTEAVAVMQRVFSGWCWEGRWDHLWWGGNRAWTVLLMARGHQNAGRGPGWGAEHGVGPGCLRPWAGETPFFHWWIQKGVPTPQGIQFKRGPKRNPSRSFWEAASFPFLLRTSSTSSLESLSSQPWRRTDTPPCGHTALCWSLLPPCPGSHAGVLGPRGHAAALNVLWMNGWTKG